MIANDGVPRKPSEGSSAGSTSTPSNAGTARTRPSILRARLTNRTAGEFHGSAYHRSLRPLHARRDESPRLSRPAGADRRVEGGAAGAAAAVAERLRARRDGCTRRYAALHRYRVL